MVNYHYEYTGKRNGVLHVPVIKLLNDYIRLLISSGISADITIWQEAA